DGQLDGAFDEKRTGARAAVVRGWKQSARRWNAAVVSIAAADIAQQRARAKQRRRSITGRTVSFHKTASPIQPARARVCGGKRRGVAVIVPVDAHLVSARDDFAEQAVVETPAARQDVA